MKKFLTYLILTLFLLYTIDRVLDAYLSSIYEKNFCENAGGDLNFYLKHDRKDVVIIGSSRVNTMINPEIIATNAINISKPAKHFYYNIAVADLLDQHKKMPQKLLVFNIEVEDLYKETEERLISDVFYLKYYYYSNEFIQSVINSKSRFEKCKFIFRSYRFNGDNFTIVTNPLQNICTLSKNGFCPLNKTQNDKIRLDQGIEEMKALSLKIVNQEFFNKLKYLVQLSKKNKIELVVLYGPNFYLPKSFEISSNLIREFCSKNKIHYLNYSLDHTNSFASQQLWYDHIHLNNVGAEKYSKMLRKDLDSLLKKTDN